ncbi:MAG: DUF4382 domain-containing protein [Halofilum sp. (in: g-proteobacteria)]|nr:DUF4382 domain-containing protein [Halofilum sp. (in: g-proteobacteria)]
MAISIRADEPVGHHPACPIDGGNGFREIDLLTLTGDKSEPLLDDAQLAAGRYDWIRLLVNAKAPGSMILPDDTIPGTNIVLDSTSGVEDLLIPSGPQTGLKLVSGFNVPSGGSASFTIDFDLRKAGRPRSGTGPRSPRCPPGPHSGWSTTAMQAIS